MVLKLGSRLLELPGLDILDSSAKSSKLTGWEVSSAEFSSLIGWEVSSMEFSILIGWEEADVSKFWALLGLEKAEVSESLVLIGRLGETGSMRWSTWDPSEGWPISLPGSADPKQHSSCQSEGSKESCQPLKVPIYLNGFENMLRTYR